MNKKFAEELDLILKGGRDNVSQFSFESEYFDAVELGAQLKKDGFGYSMGGNEFWIYPEGFAFIDSGGYTKRLRKEEEADTLRQLQIENLRLQKEVNRLQVSDLSHKEKIRKQEGVIRLWRLITAIAGIAGFFISRLLGLL